VETTGDKLKRAMKTLCLSLDEMAFIFQVSAARVCQWFTDDSLEGEEKMQLQYCLGIARQVELAEAPRFDLVIRHPLPDGESLLEKLKGRRVTVENMRYLRELAKSAKEQRDTFKGSGKQFQTIQKAINLYATPLYYEVQ
jgi:hypothetical protein